MHRRWDRAPFTSGERSCTKEKSRTRAYRASLTGSAARISARRDLITMTFPPFARVRQSIPQPRVEDIPGTVRRLIQSSRLRERVPRGGRIAVGVGSRGVHGIALVSKSIVETLQQMGYQPFIVAAMGS